jgi:glycosyltransferase involved in cell wall biosynthesis
MIAAASKPRISIGMPVYNREKYVAAAIESHLNQTYSDFELIITDNASTDRSEEICRLYASRDPRVKYYRNVKNLGAAGNYRLAFELATGEFFRWHPSDDLISPNLLERAIQILDQDPSIFVAYARTKLIDGKGNPIGDFNEGLHIVDDQPSARWKSVHVNLRLGNLPYGVSRTEKLRRTGLLRNYMGGDLPLIAEMSLYGKFYEIPDAIFYRRMHEGASSAMKNSSDVMAFFDPNKTQRKVFLHKWTHLGANLKSVSRAPIPFGEKLRIYAFQARWVIWSRSAYFNELKAVVQQIARGWRRS